MPPVAYKTCDICRKRKTKCIPPPDDNDAHDNEAPCTNCTRLGIPCTYDHVYKRPGRPSSYAKAYHEEVARRAASSSVEASEPSRYEGHEHGHGQDRRDTWAGPSSSSTSHNTAHRPGNHPDNDPGPSRHSMTPGPVGLSMDQIQPRRSVAPSSDYSRSVPVPGPISGPGPSATPLPPIPPIFATPAAPSTGLPLLDAFSFAEPDMFADFDPDAGEHDLAIDWPTMSSGNGGPGTGTGGIGTGGSHAPGMDGGGAVDPLLVLAQTDGHGAGSGAGAGAGAGHGSGPVLAGGGYENHPTNSTQAQYGSYPGSESRYAQQAMQPVPGGTSYTSNLVVPSQPRGHSHRNGTGRSSAALALARDRDFQIEEIAPWNTISFFISLYLGYSHSLFPMVHRPSFSQRLAMRDDKRDRDFRALVLGIVAYTIGQSPLSRMTGAFDRHELSSLQHRCHRGSMMLLDRSYKAPSVLQVATLSAGYFYCQSVGKTNRALTLVSEACQLMHLLRMHDDEATDALNLDAVEVQVRRRIWWHVYAVDITEASAGHMIHLNSFEGQPSFPAAVDDEYLTSQGSFPQPPGATSYIVGLVACVRLFPVLEEVLTRSRSLRARNRLGRHMGEDEVRREVDWVARAGGEVDGIMQGLPGVLKMGEGEGMGVAGAGEEGADEVRMAVMGMQRANMAITAVSIRFALADYRSELEPNSTSLDADRAAMGREAYRVLSNIPLDDLAANGESMRGKIFRILLALLKCVGDSQDWATTLQDWWTLFSRVQFVQLMTSNVESRLPSREHTPDPQAAGAMGG